MTVLMVLLCVFVFGNAQSVNLNILPADVGGIIYDNLKIEALPERDFKLLSAHRSEASGLRHLYFQERYRGVPVLESWMSLHLNDAGELVRFTDDLKRVESFDVNNFSLKEVDNQEIMSVLELCGELFPVSEKTSSLAPHVQQAPRLSWWMSDKPILAAETIFEYRDELWQVIYDVEDGRVLKQRSLTVKCNFGHPKNECKEPGHLVDEFKSKEVVGTQVLPSTGAFTGQYNYFPSGAASPLYGSRQLSTANDLIDPVAAPFGWHDNDESIPSVDYPHTQGNHVYAYYAPAATVSNPPPLPILRDDITGNYLSGIVPIPSDNSLDFNYTSGVTSSNPLDYLEDAITNLFVWNNLCHDILYRHGFDEAAGNFQDLNFGNGGAGGDAVYARAQDGSGLNNATFSTPADGLNPTMRMFLWDTETGGNFRDGDFDNVIIAHEYAHGLSFRLVGGASNVTCLGNFEQGGEGWSDFIGMLLTIDADNDGSVEEFALGEGIRSIGNFVLQQSAGDPGIRSRFYSTDMECPSTFCNDVTYAQLDQLQAPHGVGFLWGTMLWDMAWALINQYGFEPDWRNATSTAGNIRALKIVIEGMKLTPCMPTFPEMRDAVLTANNALYGNTDTELLWEVFARRGLGVGATEQGGASFSPLTAQLTKTVDKDQAEVGETVTYTINVTNNTFQTLSQVRITDDLASGLTVDQGSISDGGSLSFGQVTWPSISMAPGTSVTRTFSAVITADGGSVVAFSDPVEDITANFIPAGDWIMDSGQTNPASGSTIAWFHPSLPVLEESSLLLNIEPTASANQLVFWQWFDLESGIDGGVIERLAGNSWEDLGNKIVDMPYNGFMYDALPGPVIGRPIPFSTLSGRSGYTDYSGGWRRTVIDLSSHLGAQTIRFRYAADESTNTGECNGPGSACAGWYLDDFFLLDIAALPNEACVTSAQGYGSCDDIGIGTIYTAGALPVEWLAVTATAQSEAISIDWQTAEDGSNHGFRLERSTEQSGAWQRLGWIPATDTQFGEYTYLDKEVEKGRRYYYRLRQEDHDGRFAYSPIVSAIIAPITSVDFRVYPNPGRNRLSVRTESLISSSDELIVQDTYGRTVWRQPAQRTIEINTEAWPAGCYYINWRGTNAGSTQKWIKLR